jgi:signal transduction histidine kinase
MEVATDITEVKELERELALIGRAVAGLAHRIKNILMGLEGGLFVVNTALAKDDKSTVTQGWEMIERNVDRVSQIVKDLLYCAKKRTPEFQDSVCPQEIAQEVYDLFHERTASEDIELHLELGEPHRCTLNPDGIHSLITNLVTNAIDACRFDPDEAKIRHHITIRCAARPGGETWIEIEDDGTGIPNEVTSKVFEDFFSTKGTEGTGLGLLIISRVVEEHSGSITFTSEPGQGTTFSVLIPPLASVGKVVGPASDEAAT